MILTVGNYLNGGTARGQAYGFQLEVLLKLTNLKSSSISNGTLLHFVVRQLSAKSPECLQLTMNGWEAVYNACDVSLTEIATEIKALEEQMKQITREREEGLTMLRNVGGGDWADGLSKRISYFLSHAQSSIDLLKRTFEDTKNEMQSIRKRFVSNFLNYMM